MENLSDDLLIEIWSRVPYKIAVSCKSISKRFSALISHLQFIQRSILHHHTMLQHKNEEDFEKEWQLNFISKRKLLIFFFPNLHLSNPQIPISLSFLGRKFNPELDHVTRKKEILYSRIVGCSNGLFLCKKTTRGRVYHVCNPITKEYIKLPLPPPPLTGHNRRDRMLEGFVCEPYYHLVENAVTFNNHRFRVVRFPRFEGTLTEILWGITKSEFEMVVFSSETGQWNRKMVPCSMGICFTQSTLLLPVVAHEGRLYFSGKNSLLVYDPFNSDEQCDIINYPSDTSPKDIVFNGHVGVCCGNIRISSVNLYDSVLGVSVKVWELEREVSSGWRLLHVTGLPRQHVRDCIKEELLTGREGEIVDMGMQVRAFHPYHGDVLFFQRAHRIFVGNLKSNRFDTVGYGIHGFYSLQMFSLHLPFWPTPIP